MSKKKIISAGHICLDITPAFKDRTPREAADTFVPGKLIAMDPAALSLGGSVSNTGVGMKRLGADVELMGMVGDDGFGEIVLGELKKYGVDPESMIVNPDVPTSYSVVLAAPGIDRIFLHCSGANDTFSLENLDMDKVKEASLFHFGYPTLMKSMYENNGEKLIEMIKAVHDAGVATSLDFAMVEETTPAGQQDWDKVFREVMPYVDFFVPSVEELCLLMDRERYHEWVGRAAGKDICDMLDIQKDVVPLADKLLSYGAKVILIKCGTPGLYFRTAGKEKLAEIGGGIGAEIADNWADREAFEKSYLVEHVVSGTGAGDTTIAAFLCAATEGYDYENALHLATATGALVVQTVDAVSGLKPLSEIKKLIDAGWKKRD